MTTLTETKPNHKWLIFIAMSVGIVMSNIELTAINLALVSIANDLQVSMRAMQWILNSMLLTYASFIIVGGRFADAFGRRRTFIFGMFIFVIASLFGGFAQNEWELITARVFQGFSAGFCTGLSTAAIYSAFPDHERTKALGLFTAVIGFSLALGPTIGGYLCQYWSWRWIFFINVPLGLLAILLTSLYLPKTKPTDQKIIIDYIGIIMLIVGIVGVIFSCNQVEEWGWNSPLLISVFSASIFLLILFYWHEKKHPQPLITTEILHNKNFLAGCSIRLLSQCGFYIPVFLISLYLQNILGLTPAKAGSVLLWMTLMIGIFSPVGGMIIERLNARLAVIISTLLFTLVFVLFSQLKEQSAIWEIISLLILAGCAYGLYSPALLRLTMKSVDDNHLSVASGTFYMNSMAGGILTIAIAGAVMSAQCSNKLIALAAAQKIFLSKTTAKSIMQTLYSSHSNQGNLIHLKYHLPPIITALSHQAFMHGYTIAMLICSLLTFMATLVAYFGLSRD